MREATQRARTRLRIRMASWLIAALVMVVFSLLPELVAAPSVSRGRISIGFSLRLFRFSWGEFSCFVENPDPTPHKIMVRVLAGDDNFGQQQTNVFSDMLVIPPQTEMNYRSPIMVETAESYRVEVFIDGRQQGTSEELLIKTIPSKSTQIAILDEGEVSIGAYTQLDSFKNEYFSCTMNSRTLPEQWELLAPFAAIVVMQPDLSQYSSRQVRAFVDYVRQGGTVIFADPAALFKLAESPWAELLPVRPLKLRKVWDIPSLAASSFLSGFKGWPEPGVDFLESEAKGQGIDLLRHEGFPLFRWKKYGLGICRFSAIPIDEKIFKDPKERANLLHFLLGTQKLCPEPERYNSCLDEMTGFPIPRAGVLRSIFISYFIILGVLLSGGLYTRKTGIAWVASALAAILMTFYVLDRAKAEVRQKGKMLSMIDFSVYGGATTPTETYCSIFSDSNAVLDLGAASENTLLSGIPPNTNSYIPIFMQGLNMSDDGTEGRSRKQSRFKIAKKLDIQRLPNGLAILPSLNISTNTTRQFRLQGTQNLKPVSWEQPKLLYGKDGPLMAPWQVPAGIKFDQAFLLFPGGLRQLAGNGRTLSDSGKETGFQPDSLLRELQGCLEYAYRTPSPCLALVDKNPSPPLEIPGGASCQGRRITLFPLSESCTEENIVIDRKQVLLTPGDSPTGMIMDGNRFKQNPNINGAMSYSFKFALPPQFSSIEPEEIVVRFDYRSQGGGITVRPLLLLQAEQKNLADDERDSLSGSAGTETAKPGKPAPKKPVPASKPPVKKAAPKVPVPPPSNLPPSIAGKELSPGVFVFSGADLKRVINPSTGTGVLMLDAQEGEGGISETQRLRGVDKWEPVDLGVSLKGRLPAGVAPFTY